MGCSAPENRWTRSTLTSLPSDSRGRTAGAARAAAAKVKRRRLIAPMATSPRNIRVGLAGGDVRAVTVGLGFGFPPVHDGGRPLPEGGDRLNGSQGTYRLRRRAARSPPGSPRDPLRRT